MLSKDKEIDMSRSRRPSSHDGRVKGCGCDIPFLPILNVFRDVL
jgi:hypothetical protein